MLSREYYYLGTQLPMDRFLTFYYGHPGYVSLLSLSVRAPLTHPRSQIPHQQHPRHSFGPTVHVLARVPRHTQLPAHDLSVHLVRLSPCALNSQLTSPSPCSAGQFIGGQGGCYNLVPVYDWIKRCVISIFIVFFIGTSPYAPPPAPPADLSPPQPSCRCSSRSSRSAESCAR